MREELRPLLGKRGSFKATFVRFGKKTAYRGPAITTLLFRDVTHGGKPVTDHVWFTTCKGWAKLLLFPGNVVTFTATVATYRAGYRGRRHDDDDDLPGERVDYKLKRPAQMVRLDDVAPDQPLLEL